MKIINASTNYLDTKGLSPYQFMERVGRICYKSEDKITDESAVKFIGVLAKNKHTAMLEHAHIYLDLNEMTLSDIVSAMSMESMRAELHNITPVINYFNITNEGPAHILSGSFRAFINLFENEYLCMERAVIFIKHALTKTYPEVFGELTDTELELLKDQDEYTKNEYVAVYNRDEFIDFVNRVFTPESVNLILYKHLTHTVLFICDRGITHEFVRHRPSSFAQESTRYCLAGNTKLKTLNPHAYKRIKIKQLNEDTGKFEYSKIKNVYLNGEKTTYKITTDLGYTLECTIDHKIYTPNGYKTLNELNVGDFIYVNGTQINSTELYKNQEWLYYQNITLNKTFVQIANEFGFNVSTIKKWARKLNIPKKGTGYFNVGREPWNKGLSENDDIRVNTQVESFCHSRIHNKSLEILYADKIVSIEKCVIQKVYDIEMDSNYHNFVADGVVVHNCNYSHNKFDGEITFIKPLFFDEDTKAYELWEDAVNYAESKYFDLLISGAKPEQARSVLPNSVKTEIVITTTESEWQHIINLRLHGTTGSPHPQMVEVMNLAYPDLDKHSNSRLK